MRAELISDNTAKLAKEKGFNLIDFTFYEGNKVNLLTRQYFLQEWLREVHGIQINIDHYTVNDDIEQVNDELWHYVVRVSKFPECNTHDSFVKSAFIKYEEALEEGLYEALKLINNENS